MMNIIRKKLSPGPDDKFRAPKKSDYANKLIIDTMIQKRNKVVEILELCHPDDIAELAAIVSEKKDIDLKRATGSDFVAMIQSVVSPRAFDLIFRLFILDNTIPAYEYRKLNSQKYIFVEPE